MILYHGTSAKTADEIEKNGFIPDKTYNWQIKSRKGLVYLSLAYAPFYSEYTSKDDKAAIIKVEVDEKKLLPEDDFVMAAVYRKPKYTQKELNKADFSLATAQQSLAYLGNASAHPKDIKIIGIKKFDCSKLVFVCDPVITHMNYVIMGEYYKDLTEYIYQNGKHKGFLWLQTKGLKPTNL